MQTYIPQPPSLKGDERAQLEQMYRYLYKMSEQLNTALAVTDKGYQIVVQTKSGSAPGSESPITPQLDAQYRELRSLIIKTADIVNQQMDKTIKQLNGKFEAISSEWGTFEQNIERKIVETAEATIDSFDYSEKIHGIEKTVLNGETSYAIESLGYIKRGIIGFDDENFPIYGIAVGTELKEKTVEKDGKTYQQIDTTKRIATYTSDAITFWRNDVAIARFSGDELYVTRAEITQQIRLGDWFFSVVESGGLNISKRLGSAIDISENGTITSLVGDIDEANTSIIQTRNDIKALAKRTSTAEDKISSTESKLELKADSATLSVMETNLKQYTNNAVDNISVGGRNLLRDTNQGTVNWDWSMQTGGKTIEEYLDGGVRAVKMTRDATPHVGWSVISYSVSEDAYALLEPNTEYTLSFDYKPSVATANGVMFSIRRGDGSNAATNDGGYWKEIPANEWTHVSGTFTTVENIPDFLVNSTEIYITRLPTTVGSVHIFKNLKLEKGNKSTDWSPAPEDPAGSLSVNSDYSKVDINTERVRIVSKRMEVAVPSDDGEDDVLRVDADGVHAEVVEADVIVSESVVRTQGAASYTPANAGELAVILEELSGKCLTGDVDVNCINVSSGSFEVQGLCGAAGKLTLRNGALNALTVRGCGRNVIVYVESMEFSTSGVAVTVDDGAVMLLECSLNAGTGLRLGANWPSEVWLSDCEGDCTTLAALSSFSRLWASGSKPTGTLSLGAGSEVYNATPDPTFETATAPSIPTTQTVTVSLSPTSTSTSGYGSKLYQGRYSSSQSLRKGVMLFSLPSDLTSADKIDSATLTIKRIGGVGQGGGVSVHVRCYDVPGTLYASKTAYENQTVSIDVTSAVKAMKTSGYTGLMLYNPDTTTVGSKSYTASYSRFAGKGESGEPVLKISYRK